MTLAGSDDSAHSLKTDLLRPEAFEALVGTRDVSFVETHISWVFLLDRDVFKVKKPVDLGFLDFRTQEQRRLACEDEVRLNARLAPGVYLGVVPVARDPDGRYAVGGVGEVVDWAVHMARLPDGARADHLLERGELSPERIDAIGARIAEFHGTAHGGPEAAGYGGLGVIGANVQENFDQTRSSLDRYLTASEADEIVRWQTAFVRDRRERFERRVAGNHIREGHGDLRLEHVYVGASGEITVLDCIEFNERFRYGDTCADVAFLSMDLAAHRRVDLAERLLATYAREADDFNLYGVVDFYESYRAFVRGKVTSMLAGDDGASDATRQEAAREARKYFLLALASERPSVLWPALVAVGGVIASGKTAIADRVGEAMSAPVVSADRTRKGMLGVEPTRPVHEAAWSGAYDPDFTNRVYAELLRRASIVLDSGRPVVLDASFRSAAHRDQARKLARECGVPFRFVECRTPPDVCRQRLALRARQRGVSDGRLAIFDDFLASFEAVDELPPLEHMVVDTTTPLDESMDRLRRDLDVWPRGLAG